MKNAVIMDACMYFVVCVHLSISVVFSCEIYAASY